MIKRGVGAVPQLLPFLVVNKNYLSVGVAGTACRLVKVKGEGLNRRAPQHVLLSLLKLVQLFFRP